MKFSDLGLSAKLEQTVNALGYAVPTAIQGQAIPLILQGRDLFGCAQTGTGKTASFILPMIDILQGSRSKVRMPRSIVLEPTRELAAQVFESFEAYGKDHPLKAALLVGGESMSDQEKQLKRGVDVLIATPGRLLDLFERGQILLADVKILVIDEADRMLDMGFIPDIDRIVTMLPKMRQTLLFSATMPDEIKKLAQSYLINPKEIIITPAVRTAATITQYVLWVKSNKKREALRYVLETQDVSGPVIIFCNRKRDISILASSLKRHKFDAGCLHGDMPQSQRNQTLEDFKSGKLLILVASDVAARGLDVDGLSLVVNFDVPINAEDYVHRIGRTGRAGNEGVSVTLVAKGDEKNLTDVQNYIHQQIPVMAVKGMSFSLDSPDEDEKLAAPSKESGRDRSSNHRNKRGNTSPKQNEERPKDSSKQNEERLNTPSKQNEERPKDSSFSKKPHRKPVVESSEEPRVGFGTDVPAFMLKETIFKDA